ncbi:MAG: YidC/Oxa1 family membrane protein insertase [Clostridia bacterium]
MGFFDIIIFPFAWFFAQLYALTGNFGWCIIIFTIFSKIILLPFAIKQQKTTLKQAKYQPKITEIQEKYKTNKVKQNEELQKLYTAEGYNPMGGCLPVLIQFPIILILYNVVQNPLSNILGASKETITHLQNIAMSLPGVTKDVLTNQIGLYDVINKNIGTSAELQGAISNWKELNFSFLGINLTERPTIAINILIIVPILAFSTALLLSFITQKYSAIQSNGSTKMMMLMSPFMSLFFTFSFSAGIGLYWIIGNVFAIIQAIILGEIYNPKKYIQKIQEEEAREREEKKAIKRAKNSAKYKYNKKGERIIDAEFTEIDDDDVDETITNKENSEVKK